MYDLDITLPMVGCPCRCCRRHMSPCAAHFCASFVSAMLRLYAVQHACTASAHTLFRPPAGPLPPPQVAVVLANFAAFAGVCWLAFLAARSFFALFGWAQPLALAAAAAYLTLSFWIYSRPVNALQLHQKLARKSLRPSQLAQSEKDLRALGKRDGAAAAADSSQQQEQQKQEQQHAQ